MFNYIDKYVVWTHTLEPAWVGAFMFFFLILAATIATLVCIFIFSFLVYFTEGWVLLVIPAFIMYTVYLAINQ
jgi:hypothetical protein